MIYILETDTCFGLACSIYDIKNYEKIYKIKKRKINNPLAIMVDSFKWLRDNTSLSIDQIEFLKNYDKPFTVVTKSSSLNHWINYTDEHGVGFNNSDIYEKIAFRIAHNEVQKKLIKKVGPIFLTSANLSGNGEIYNIKTLKEVFSYYLDKKILELISHNDLKESSASDVFEFIGDTTELNYFRKN